MPNKKGKKLAVLSVITLAIGLVAGCSGGKKEEASPSPSPAASQAESSSPSASASSAAPEVKYPESVSYWSELNPNVAAIGTSLNDVAAWREFQNRTGTKIDFQHAAADGHAGDQLNLMLASGKLPDIIFYNWLWVPKGPDNAIKEKQILRLNELIEQHAPNLTKYLNEHPDVKKMMTSDEGNIYVMPLLRGDPYLVTYVGPVIREDWLKKLNLSMPTTISEWETALTAFRDQDPNGNGKKDEVPYFLANWIIDASNTFVGAWGITPSFYHDNGTVKFGPIQPEFKEYLGTLARWYKEGLIYKDYASADGNLINSMILNDQFGALIAYGSQVGKFEGKPNNPDFNLAGAPYPALNPGEKAPIGQKDAYFNGFGAAITAGAKNPEQIVKWLDYLYGEEGTLLFNFGIEGESYTMVDGYPTYTDKLMKNPDLPISQAMAKYVIAGSGGAPFILDKRYYEQFAGQPVQKAAITTWMEPSNERLMPPITLTSEEGDKVGSIMNDVYTYRDEMMNKFIMGVEPIEKFDEFVSTIKSMGIDEAVQVHQTALERYNKR